MKKLMLLLSLALGCLFINAAATPVTIPLQVDLSDVGPTGTLGGHPRTPVAKPKVAQDGHTLYFTNVGYDLTLVLLDEDGEEAYTDYVPAGTATVTLPSVLMGGYELRLYPASSSYFFYSDITL